VNEVVADELESFRDLRARVARRIAKNTEQVFSVNIGCFIAQVIEVDKEVKHQVFVHDAVPVFLLNSGKNSRAKSPVERNNFVKLFKAGPRDVLSPTRIRFLPAFRAFFLHV